MIMRVTTKMLSQSLINNVNTNLNRMEKYQNQLSSGRLIDRPSDDPVATSRLLAAKSDLKAQEQYSSNMKDAAGWLDTVDGALESVGNVLQRAREIAVTGSSGTLAQASMGALADEVDNMVAELVQTANSSYADKYLFGGGKSGRTPFEVAGRDNHGRITDIQFISADFDKSLLAETYSRKIEIEAGVTIDIACGKTVFHTDTNGNAEINAVFNKLIELREKLDAGDQNAINPLISDIDKYIDNVLSERAVGGAKSKRIEIAQSRLSAYELNLTDLVGKLEDTDYAITFTSYTSQKTIYQATLAVGAKLIQPSLLDFLR